MRLLAALAGRSGRYQGRWREMLEPLGADAKADDVPGRPERSSPRPRRACPSSIGGERNYDYRYTWIRDAAFSFYALLRLGFTEEAAAFMDWLTERFRERGRRGAGPLQIMYGIDGRSARGGDRSGTSRATAARGRSASGTRPQTSSSSTSTASSWTRSTSTTSRAKPISHEV